MSVALPPALLALADGQLRSQRFADVYSSKDGALAQAEQVFLRGVGLPEAWRDRAQFSVLELGFGLGNNFLATWQAWRSDPRACTQLNYLAIEGFPPSRAELALVPAPGLGALHAELLEQWPRSELGLHELSFAQGRVRLQLSYADVLEALPRLSGCADAAFLDGFAPARNPQMWSAPVFTQLRCSLKPGARIATWCVARAVRERLTAAGFTVRKLPGFAHKRERLEGVLSAPEAAEQVV